MPSARAMPRGVAAFQALAQMRQRGERQLARRGVARHRRMRGKKHRDAASAVVEIRAEADELENLGIAEPVEADPGGARSAANGVTRHFRGDVVGFGGERCFGAARAAHAPARRAGGAAAAPAAAFGVTELVFSRMTSICQAISRFIEVLQTRARRDPVPESRRCGRQCRPRRQSRRHRLVKRNAAR